MELLFLTLGYFTQVSQIQEFCVFAFIGLCVDLYMQVSRMHILDYSNLALFLCTLSDIRLI